MFTSTSDQTIFDCPSRPLIMDRSWKSNSTESAPNCPRCASSNTKFCYYNNYSLSQPRYFCKGCRRYWTKGGSLRNVPVGGGCRKTRRSKSARQADRLGLSYQMPSPGSTSDESNNSGNGVDIDLAVVFAKFLNQENSSNDDVDKINVSNIDQESSSSGVSCTSLDNLPLGSSLGTENHIESMSFQCQEPSDHHFIHGDQMHEELPSLCSDLDNVEEFLNQNCNAFELQDVLGEEIVDDHAFSNYGTSFPNFEWQSTTQSQDFGSFAREDVSMKIPSIFGDDNWNTFDVSAGYEIFSRPWNCI